MPKCVDNPEAPRSFKRTLQCGYRAMGADNTGCSATGHSAKSTTEQYAERSAASGHDCLNKHSGWPRDTTRDIPRLG